jgi:hypothetical protein
MKSIRSISLLLLLSYFDSYAQTDTTAVEEDYSIYENTTTLGQAKIYCSPKIFDLSPNRFISVGYDYQMPYELKASAPGSYDGEDKIDHYKETGNVNYMGGLRVMANIPVVSVTKILWQIGGQYTRTAYDINYTADTGSVGLLKTLHERGLRNTSLNTTIFKPLNSKLFIIFQGMGEANGDYTFSKFQDLGATKMSASVLFGKRPHDRRQWAVGLSRTYRAGELNYIPIILYNYTAVSRKWGLEFLLPAKAAYRRTFNSRSILLAGYEMEGGSYRLNSLSDPNNNVELRRGELRFKLDYQRQLKGFIWIGVQAGFRQNLSYNVDKLPAGDMDIFRGFFGNQRYFMLTETKGTPYFNISINLVSP